MNGIRGDQRMQAQVLEGLAMAVNHRRWFVELALPYLGDDPIELGSGLGDYADEWAQRLGRFTATEADPERLVALKERFAGRSDVTVRQLVLPSRERSQHSAAVSYNVLEHIEDHVDAVRSIASLVEPGGAVVLVVPAFQFAMSEADVVTGHVRRYTKASLATVLHEAGLLVERVRYVNALGLIGYVAATKVLGLMPKEGPMVRCYDRYVLPATRALEWFASPPFGQSVFALARTPSR